MHSIWKAYSLELTGEERREGEKRKEGDRKGERGMRKKEPNRGRVKGKKGRGWREMK